MRTKNKIQGMLSVIFLLCGCVLSYAEIVKEYYDTGQLKIELNYKNGKREGIAKEYYKAGRLKQEENYWDRIWKNELHSETKIFNKGK